MGRRILAGQITQPAASSDWSYCFSQNEYVKIISLFGTFTTSATVWNRYPALALKDQAGVIPYTMGAASAQAASTATIYQISKAFGTVNTSTYNGLNVVNLSLPEMVLPPGWSIESVTSGIQTGDQWSGLVWVAEFGPTVFEEDQRALALADALAVLQAQQG